jgi:spore coat polysaccharide biosynthesis protein SpsF (cytidylyltransferase family)
MLIEKVGLLNSQVNTLTEINKLYSTQDSIRSRELDLYKGAYQDGLDRYTKLNKKYKVSKVISLSSLLILLGALLWR